MLAKWLVEDLGSGSIADYYDLPERYLWAKIAVAAGAPLLEADYISLPKNYVWKAIYDAVSGSSLGTIDWVEKQALGHIAAAYRGDTANPANLATYIDWPWRYQVASIIGGIGPAFPSAGLLAFWKLDGLTDSSGNGNNLTNNNSVTFESAKIGNGAIVTEGQYLSTNLSSSLDLNGQSSFSAWVKITSTASDVISVLFGKQTGMALFYNATPSSFVCADYQGAESVFLTEYILGDWVHLAFVINNSSVELYFNGVSLGTETNVMFDVSDINLGPFDTSYGWDGSFDAVGIWNRAITSQEVATLYNNGTGLEP
jgi:hypothetical protein